MAHYLVTGGAGFIGSHLAEALVRRGESVRVVDSLVTGKRQNLAHLPEVEFLHGDLADADVARAGRDRRGLRAASGGHPVGAAVGGRSHHLEPRQYRRLAQPAGRRARRQGAPRGLRRVVVGVRQHADAAEGGDHADGAALALRAAEAGGGAVLPDVHVALRARDRDHALLQRVRAAAGSVLALLGRDLALHQRALRRPPADDLRRRRAHARLHLRGQRGGRRAQGVPRAEGERGSDQRGHQRPHLAQPPLRHGPEPGGRQGRAPLRAARARAT